MSITAIPKMTCPPKLSIDRLSRKFYSRVDTVNLRGLFNYTDDDLNSPWPFTEVKVTHNKPTNGTHPRATTACVNKTISDVYGNSAETDWSCIAGTELDSVGTFDDFTVLTFLNTAYINGGADRNWVAELPCASDAGDDSDSLNPSLLGPASVSGARVQSLSMPTFVPRAGGGKKGNLPLDALRVGTMSAFGPMLGFVRSVDRTAVSISPVGPVCSGVDTGTGCDTVLDALGL
jgi:hypothetical protein